MFAILEIKENSQGILALMKNHISKPEMNVRRVKISGGQPFFILSIRKSKNIPWQLIENKIGRLSGRMLLPNNVTPPSDSNVKALTVTRNLPAKMLLSTAIEISKLLKKPAVMQKITVVDRTGVYIDQIEFLIKYASVVRVITDKIKQYDEIAQDILYKWGASISVAKDLRNELKSDIIISPFEQIDSADSLVLSTDTCKVMTARTAISPQISLPEEYKGFIPLGIDEQDFACALYDACGLTKLADMNFETMLFEGTTQSIKKIANSIEYQKV